jgi:hypothetical protein
MTFDQQIRLDRTHSAQAARAAGRELRLEFGTRIDDLEELLAPFPPPECYAEYRPRGFDCKLSDSVQRRSEKPFRLIVWAPADRRVLAGTLSLEQWAAVADAYEDWTNFVERYGRATVIRGKGLTLAVRAYESMGDAQQVLNY